MSHNMVRIRELAAWELDASPHRPAHLKFVPSSAADGIVQHPRFEQSHVLLETHSEQLHELFDACASRSDLRAEMAGLSWSLGVVDIRPLIAFQRRLAFSPNAGRPSVPRTGDWPSLFALSFGLPKPVEYEMTSIRDPAISTQTFILQSTNPDLHVRVAGDTLSPFTVHAGGPFFEVAWFRGRWFLRDGYHRAFALLQAGVFQVPAVIVHAATLDELGASGPGFFPEEILFSQTPPRVVDFLNQQLVFEYERPPFLKTIRIQIEETIQPATQIGEQP